MTSLKQLAGRLTPAVLLSLTAGVLTVLAAFHVTLTVPQQGSIVLFVGAVGTIVHLKHFTVETVTAIIAAALAVAVAFGLPVSSAQTESIVALTALLATVALGKVGAKTIKARRQASRPPSVADAFKTGRRPPKNAPALLLGSILTGAVPAHPATADHFAKLSFGLYGNDKYGVCGPTSVANLVRLVTGGLLGAEITPSQEDVYDLYRRSGNPNFKPASGSEDNGVDMQTMLDALLKDGIGDGKGGKVKPVAFAKINVNSDAELEAAVSIFGGALWGVNLLEAQQSQTNTVPPKWDYRNSAEWGGHAVLDGAYEAGGLEDVISWALRVETTSAFRTRQLEEAWAVIWPWNLEHPAFQEGVDVSALAAAYTALTGKVLPNPAPTPPAPTPAPAPTPNPVPTPTPAAPTDADRALWAAAGAWAKKRHSGTTKPVADRLIAWAKEVGLA